MDFESVFVLLLIGIIIVLLLRQDVQCALEPFSLQDNMNADESEVHPGVRYNKFAMECCPSLYSNHEGCACDDNEINTMLKSRGQNNSLLH